MTLYWPSLEAFLDMGGYGLYVWGSYAVTVLVVALELWSIRARRKALASEIEA
jgi:heme exporter protein D